MNIKMIQKKVISIWLNYNKTYTLFITENYSGKKR